MSVSGVFSSLSDFERGAEHWYGNGLSAIRVVCSLWQIIKVSVETDRSKKLVIAIQELGWGIVGLIPVVGQITFRVRNLMEQKNHCKNYVNRLSNKKIEQETQRLQKQENLTKLDQIYLETLLLPSRKKTREIVKEEAPALGKCPLHVREVANAVLDQSTLLKKEILALPPLSNRIQQLIVSISTPWKPKIATDGLSPLQQNLLKMIRGETISLAELPQKKELLLSVVSKQNPAVLQEAHALIQLLLIDVHQHLLQEQNLEQTFHLEAIIGELLSFYPFLSPSENMTLQVPTLNVFGIWELVDYTVNSICLTQETLGSPMTAYGLIAKDAPPLLLFKGTTYPADKGFALSLLTDLNPFYSVGGWAHTLAKNSLSDWFEQHVSASSTDSQKARVFGKSLGGSLSLLTAINWPEKIQQITTYGAPGLNPLDIQKLQSLKEQGLLPKIQAFCQQGDPIPYTDFAATRAIDYYLVLGQKDQRGPLAHAEMYTTHTQSAILHFTPTHSSKLLARTTMTIIRFVISWTIFPFLFLGYAGYLTSKYSRKKFSSFSYLLSRAR